MKSRYIDFLKHILILSAMLGSVAIGLRFGLPGSYLTPAWPYLILFFISTTLLSFYYLLESASKRFMKFVNTFFLTILIKLFVYAGVMIAYVLVNRSDAVPFMLGFFVLYLCYTIFESVSIIKYTQPPGPGKQV